MCLLVQQYRVAYGMLEPKWSDLYQAWCICAGATSFLLPLICAPCTVDTLEAAAGEMTAFEPELFFWGGWGVAMLNRQ